MYRKKFKRERPDMPQRSNPAAATPMDVDEVMDNNLRFDEDNSDMVLKPDHENRPLWVCKNLHVFLETFSPVYKQAYDFMIAVAEPICRPEFIHEYKITAYSLYAAASVGLRTEEIISGLNRLSKNVLDDSVSTFIKKKTQKCGKLKMVLRKGRYYLESTDKAVLDMLLDYPEIRQAKRRSEDEKVNEDGFIEKIIQQDDGSLGFKSVAAAMGMEADEMHLGPEVVLSFEIDENHMETVKQKCQDIGYPCVEEYDFRNDRTISDIPFNLKPLAKHRPYQEKSLSKMFGNGRARSGIIVLPCGAGKTLVGITATATVRKSCIMFCNTTVSVHQWCQQLKHWSNIDSKRVVEFSSQLKQELPEEECIVVTTYNMISVGGTRAAKTQKILDQISGREWGLLVLDEVHIVPAKMFRKVVTKIRSKCKLGLTATLVREDDKTQDLFYLIGPKLYEANWLDLQRAGYLALVQCVEIWCPMSAEFYTQYLVSNDHRKRMYLTEFNPNKFRSMQYLIEQHENRGDKCLVFSDNIHLLKLSAKLLKKPMIYGDTRDAERKYWLHRFNYTSELNCLFISAVGDTSIDLPDVNVIIQISSHFGSRRQEAQRLGRILRPKPRTGDEFNAFFYSLVSKDTADMKYAAKRQRFLVDQGYSFNVLTELVTDKTPGLLYGTPEERNDLLVKVLSYYDNGVEMTEDLFAPKEDSEMPDASSSRGGLRDQLTGASGSYDEYTGSPAKRGRGRGRKSGGRGRGRGRGGGKVAKRKPKTAFFKKASQARKKREEIRRKYLPS